jgi:hypothetical protein
VPIWQYASANCLAVARAAPGDLPLGYFLLADLFNRVGDAVRSGEYAGLF